MLSREAVESPDPGDIKKLTGQISAQPLHLGDPALSREVKLDDLEVQLFCDFLKYKKIAGSIQTLLRANSGAQQKHILAIEKNKFMWLKSTSCDILKYI